jgi:hypothetical protein
MVAELSNLAGVSDGYEKAVLEIEKKESISVPELSRLLGVKTTTINARFRREGIQPELAGRTNFIPCDVALSLANMHQYALKGWPTLQDVSRATGIKTGTLKARCEKGKLEAYVDLTKRLRVNPADMPSLSPRNPERAARPDTIKPRREVQDTSRDGRARRISAAKPPKEISSVPTAPAPAHNPFTLPPAPEPRVQIITAQDYGFSPRNDSTPAPSNTRAHHSARKRGALDYDPEKPFSISQCTVGKTVHYEKHDGTILKLIPDPFNPAIKVAFPQHEEPLMREILLRVGR